MRKQIKRNPKVEIIKKAIKFGWYNWKGAIEDTASRIIQNPESLLWS